MAVVGSRCGEECEAGGVGEGVEVAASMAGKIKTVCQMVAIGFLTMQWPFSEFLLWLSVALTLYSGFEYVNAYVKHVKNQAKNLKYFLEVEH